VNNSNLSTKIPNFTIELAVADDIRTFYLSRDPEIMGILHGIRELMRELEPEEAAKWFLDEL
jgi:hypothetical protein